MGLRSFLVLRFFGLAECFGGVYYKSQSDLKGRKRRRKIKMKTETFNYQKYGKKVACGGIVLVAVLVINLVLSNFIENETIFYICCFALIFLSEFLYFKLTENMAIFRGTGTYHLKNGRIIVELEDRTYTIGKIQEIIGWTTSTNGSKSGILEVRYGMTRMKLYSVPFQGKKKFDETGLFELYQAIKRCNPNLKKEKNMRNRDTEFWYVSR